MRVRGLLWVGRRVGEGEHTTYPNDLYPPPVVMNLHRDETTKKAMAVAATRFTSDVLFGSGSRSRGQEDRQK